MNRHEIRQLRIDAGLTQARFAQLLSVSPKTIEAWEGGWRKCPPAMQQLIKFVLHKPE